MFTVPLLIMAKTKRERMPFRRRTGRDAVDQSDNVILFRDQKKAMKLHKDMEET